MFFGARNLGRNIRRPSLVRLALRVEVAISNMLRWTENGRELLDVLDDLPELLATFDRDGRLLFLNEAGRRLLDWEEPALEDALLSDLFSERDSERLLQEALSQAARRRRWSGWGALVRRRGRPVPVHVELVSHSPAEKMRRAFTVLARPAGAALESPDPHTASPRFLHDLNNLMGPILAYASLAESQVEETSVVKRYLGHILGAAKRARELVGRAQRPTRARQSAEQSRIVLSELVREIADWLRVEHPRHRIDVDALSAASLLGDRAALEQTILNLCYNAVESLSEEGGRVTLTVRELEDGKFLRMTVRDNGCGMDEDLLGRVFEPFFSTKPGGTGVGLAAAREIVRRHGGAIHVESAPGAGTSVHVDLPLGDGP